MSKKEGYLMIDHRASPGIPEDIARLSGYDPALCGEGKLFETATLSCAHCRGVVIKNLLRTREREFCMKCGGRYICDVCAFNAAQPGYVHAPFDKVLDQVLTDAALGSPRRLLEG
jgi:hypothetical protein